MTAQITALARKCANADLKLVDARDLFIALYIADALMLEGGNRTRTAARLGTGRTYFAQRRRRKHRQSLVLDEE